MVGDIDFDCFMQFKKTSFCLSVSGSEVCFGLYRFIVEDKVHGIKLLPFLSMRAILYVVTTGFHDCHSEIV